MAKYHTQAVEAVHQDNDPNLSGYFAFVKLAFFLVKNIIKGFNKRGLIAVWHSMIPRCYTVIVIVVTLEELEAFGYFSRSYLL